MVIICYQAPKAGAGKVHSKAKGFRGIWRFCLKRVDFAPFAWSDKAGFTGRLFKNLISIFL
jgi:hypothetical protein